MFPNFNGGAECWNFPSTMTINDRFFFSHATAKHSVVSFEPALFRGQGSGSRHFIKIPFINKGIEFIDLPSIFKDRSVTSSIPAYFQNSEPPIICYKYNKPIRNTVFNFNKLVSDLDIHANTPES